MWCRLSPNLWVPLRGGGLFCGSTRRVGKMVPMSEKGGAQKSVAGVGLAELGTRIGAAGAF